MKKLSQGSAASQLDVTQALSNLMKVLVDQGKALPGFQIVGPILELPASDSTLLDANSAALLLSLSAGTLANWRVAGRGPAFIKDGGVIRYTAGSLRNWLNSQSRSSTSQESKDA